MFVPARKLTGRFFGLRLFAMLNLVNFGEYLASRSLLLALGLMARLFIRGPGPQLPECSDLFHAL